MLRDTQPEHESLIVGPDHPRYRDLAQRTMDRPERRQRGRRSRRARRSAPQQQLVSLGPHPQAHGTRCATCATANSTLPTPGRPHLTPRLRFTPAGRAVARVRLAVNSRYQNGDGAWVDGATSWHTVQAWGPLAEHLAESVAVARRSL